MGDGIEFYDSTRLISEVQKRPAIYDKNSIEYKDRTIRDRTWKAVCEAIIPNWSVQDEKNKSRTAREVQRKWKNIRDCFRKELNNDKKCEEGFGKRKRRKYIFYDHLLFLVPYMQPMEKKDESDSLKQYSSGDDCEDRGEDTNEECSNEGEKARAIRWTHGAQQHPVYLYKDPSDIEASAAHESTNQDPDEDKYFLLSLLPTMRNLSPDQKFAAKIEFLQVLRTLLCPPCEITGISSAASASDHTSSQEPHTNFHTQIPKEEKDSDI
ncbi:uncharacterized protein [Euwallacea fornicatus]|uniref:uncharacterized protein n=1 Tax=Euwallacea fornicatus TaxID=995702 RepID=UPI00339028A0